MKPIQAGDTFTLSFSIDYDPSVYTPKLLINDGVNKYEKVGTGNFKIDITASETSEFAPGEYAYSIVLFSAEERITVESGFTKVIADLALNGANTKNKFQLIVDAIDASTLGIATAAQKNMTINGRSIERFGPDELIMLRNKYEKLAKQEERKQKGYAGNSKVYIRL